MKAPLVFLIIGASLGLGSGYLLWSPMNASLEVLKSGGADTSVDGSNAQLNEKYRILKEQYSLLESEKDKYNKAEEILTQIVQFILADLGFRSLNWNNKKVLDYLTRVSQDCNPGFVKGSDGECLPESFEPHKNKESNNGEVSKDVQGEDPIRVGSREWGLKEKKIKEIFSFSQTEDFLDSVEIKDFFSTLKGSAQKPSPIALNLNGEWEGEVTFFEKDKPRWFATLKLEGELGKSRLTGKSTIQLTKEGDDKPFSNSNSDGWLKNFRTHSGSQWMILVECNGGDGYMQLYFVTGLDALIGNYYHSQGVGEFKRTGTVRLMKR